MPEQEIREHHHTEHHEGQKKRRKRPLWRRFLTSLLWITSGIFAVLLAKSRLMPTILLVFLLLLLLFFILWSIRLMRRSHKKKAARLMGALLAILLIFVTLAGSFYLGRALLAYRKMSRVRTEVSAVNVYVRTDDPAEAFADAEGYTFGILEELDRANTDEILSQIGQEYGHSPKVAEYGSPTELVDALLAKETGAAVLNEAYVEMLADIEGYTDIDSRIRVLSARVAEIEVPVEPEPEEEPEEEAPLEDHSFIVYFTGIDTRGTVSTTSRSDVNIIAAVNPDTRQVLLVSMPRDYYVPLPISGGMPDKLTHAGIYGVDTSIGTLEMLYGIDIDYYFRVNFDGFEGIIDALGGVTVQSEYEFDSGSHHYVQGENFLNGEEALAFVRNRYSFAEGDRQRGKNQMEVIKGVADAAVSPSVLLEYNDLMQAIEGSFEMSIPYDVIADLVRSQLSDGREWNIVSYSVDGTGDSQPTYSMGSQYLYVMRPNERDIAVAKERIEIVREGGSAAGN